MVSSRYFLSCAVPETDPQLRFNVRALRPISSNVYQEGAPEALRCGPVSGTNDDIAARRETGRL